MRCYNPDRKQYRNYRIDRMEEVRHLDCYIGDEALVSADELATYTSKTIKMYGGKETEVELDFTEDLIDVVFDQFGMDTKIERLCDNRYTATVKVQISNTFWGWFFQFPDQMRIISPEAVSAQCQEWAMKALHDKTEEVETWKQQIAAGKPANILMIAFVNCVIIKTNVADMMMTMIN
ncbi:MAG: WYL domain-containing protein [Ruminococcus flavefaciens]|nr:WYL domain-containing protein [Ruminococcus flavefaciens]